MTFRISKRITKMKIRTALFTAALLATTAGYAVAQNTMSPASQARPGEQGEDSSKPSGVQNKAGTATSPNGAATTGAATTGTSPAKNKNETNVSPASPAAGDKQPAK
jgi:hypothetical protein